MSNSTIGLVRAFRIPLFFYRFFFVAPIERNADGQLVYSRRFGVYYSVVAVAYVLTFLTNQMSQTWTYTAIKQYGYIWYSLTMLDVSLSKLTFVLVTFISVRQSTQQIEFFRTLHIIDLRFRVRFRYAINYDGSCVSYAVVMAVVMAIVAFGLWITWSFLQSMLKDDLDLPITVIIIHYVLEKINLWLLTCAFVGSALIVNRRLRLLTMLLRKERESIDAGKLSTYRLGDIIVVYQQLCRLIGSLGEFTGTIILLRTIHDFFTMTATAHFFCDMVFVRGASLASSWVSLFMLAQNVARPLLVCMSAEWTLDAVGHAAVEFH